MTLNTDVYNVRIFDVVTNPLSPDDPIVDKLRSLRQLKSELFDLVECITFYDFIRYKQKCFGTTERDVWFLTRFLKYYDALDIDYIESALE